MTARKLARVDRERDGDAERPDRQAGHRRADDARAVEHRGVERDGVADVPRPDHLVRERLADGHVDGVGAAEQERPAATIIQTCTDAASRSGPRGSPPGPSSRPGPRAASGAWAARRRGPRRTGPRTMTGTNWAAATTPSQSGSPPLICRTSQAWATCCIQVPTSEIGLAGEEQPVVAVPEGRSCRGRRAGAARARRADHRRPPRRDADPGRRRARRGARRGGVGGARPRRSSRRAGRAWLRASRSGDRPGPGRRRRSAPAARSGPGRAEALAVALARGLVLQQLADLGEREPGVVAQAPDEPQALEIGRVVEAVGAIRPGGRLQQADLLVVADRPGRQAGLGGDFLDAQQVAGGASAIGRSRGSGSVTPR